MPSLLTVTLNEFGLSSSPLQVPIKPLETGITSVVEAGVIVIVIDFEILPFSPLTVAVTITVPVASVAVEVVNNPVEEIEAIFPSNVTSLPF